MRTPRDGAGLPVLRLALVTGTSGLLLVALTTVVAVSIGSATTAVVSRAVLVTALLAAATPALARDIPGPGAARWTLAVAAGLVLGYALDLAWWGGHAYVAQLAVDQPVARAVLDGLLWVAVGSFAARRATRPAGEGGQ